MAFYVLVDSNYDIMQIDQSPAAVVPTGWTEYQPDMSEVDLTTGRAVLYDPDNNKLIYNLVVHRAVAKTAIDAVTERRIIADSFEFPAASGKYFSLSQHAQTKWNGIINAVTAGIRDVSVDNITIKTKDDLDQHVFTSNGEILSAFGAAMLAVETHLVANRTAKDAIDAATTVDAIDAVVAAH